MASAESFRGPVLDDLAATVLAQAARATRNRPLRIAALARDLGEREPVRIDEARRTRMRAMLDELLRNLAGRIRRDLAARLADTLPPETAMMLGNMTLAVPDLHVDEAVDPDLVAVLARRADEHRLVMQARIAIAQDAELVERPVLPALAVHPDPALAAAARALAAQEVVRNGRFAEPVLALADLAPAVRARLVWRVAVAIRSWIGGTAGLAGIDRAIAAAGTAVLAGDEPGHHVVARGLAAAMADAGLLDDAQLVACAIEGHVAVAVACLAIRAGIDGDLAWDMAFEPDGTRLVVLLRAAGVARPAAAALILRWPDGAAPFDAIADRVAGYDSLGGGVAGDAIDLYRLDPGYVAAVQAAAARSQ